MLFEGMKQWHKYIKKNDTPVDRGLQWVLLKSRFLLKYDYIFCTKIRISA
jgi:hypothetical protein